MTSLHDILALYLHRGHLAYEGEGVTQLQHGWQCGRLAEMAGASEPLQLAAWLHDLGHLMTGLEGSPTTFGINDRHENVAAHAVRELFGPEVAEPIALHVKAKRYLITTKPGYRETLSPDATRSLALQGGAMSGEECIEFRRADYADDAIRLRVWDDLAKRPDFKPESEAQALAGLALLMDTVKSLR